MQWIGHRGARKEAPENTLGGFRYLRDLGLKAVEFDVRQLSDGTLIVIHDDSLLRTAGRAESVHQLSADLLSETDHRVGWPDWPTPEPTPLLSEVMTLLADFDHIEVELKAVMDDTAAMRLISALSRLLTPWKNQITLTSFDLKILQAAQQLAADFKRGLLIELPLPTSDIIDTAQRLGCTRVGMADRLTDHSVITGLREAGLACSVWTVNDQVRAQQLITWGADGIITDVPAQMLR